MKEDTGKTIQSPEQLADHLRVTYVPTYLLAAASAMLLMAFIVWGILTSAMRHPARAPVSQFWYFRMC